MLQQLEMSCFVLYWLMQTEVLEAVLLQAVDSTVGLMGVLRRMVQCSLACL